MRLNNLLFVVLATCFCAASAGAQTMPDAVSRYRSGTLDTARIGRTPLERARAFFDAAVYYTAEARWDSAFRALSKASRLVPIDTLLANDVPGKVTMATLELQRGQKNAAARWAHAAFADAQYRWPNDSLATLAQQLQTIHARAGQNDMAWRYRRFADSLAFEAERAAAEDSLALLNLQRRETEQEVGLLQTQLAASNEEKERWFYYALVPLAVATLALLLAVVVLMVRSTRRKPAQRLASAPTAENETIMRGAVHTMAGYTNLLLQRGRTGDDLLTLKAMERELRRLRQAVAAEAPAAPELDDDRVMRQLKGIGVLVVSDNSDAALLLKSWLRKRIRLCDVHELAAGENLPPDFLPDAIVADIDNVTSTNVQLLTQLKLQFPHAVFAVVSASVAAFDALKPHAVLRKPFHHDLLLTALMERYSPKSESVAPVLERPVPYETDVRERPVALDLAIQHRCETLERAFPANDQNALVETCRALDPLLQRAGINATKWLELLIEKPDGITTLQTQLAFKNVVTSCRQAVARLRQPNEG